MCLVAKTQWLMLPLLCELKLNECLFLLSSICPGTHVVILCYSEINTKFLGPIPGHPRYERVQRGAIYSPRGYGSALSGPEITLCQRQRPDVPAEGPVWGGKTTWEKGPLVQDLIQQTWTQGFSCLTGSQQQRFKNNTAINLQVSTR